MAIPVQETAAKVAMYGGSGGTSVAAWLSENADLLTSLGMIGGFVIALTGLIINTYYQRRRTRLMERKRHGQDTPR